MQGGVGPLHTVAHSHTRNGATARCKGACIAMHLAVEDGSVLQVHCTCSALLGVVAAEPICSVAKPDPITPHGQSSRGAAEGEERFPTAIAAIDSEGCSFLLGLL